MKKERKWNSGLQEKTLLSRRKQGGVMSTVCLGTSMSSCLTKLEQELCEWRGRKKGRQNILRILMYVGGEVVLNSHTLLRKASVLQRQNAVHLSKRLLSLNNWVNRILSLSRSPRIPFPRKR